MTTKHHRHAVYTAALDLYLSMSNRYMIGICYCIASVTTVAPDVKHDYPELYRHKPADCDPFQLWWPTDAEQTRIDVMRDCIDRTK